MEKSASKLSSHDIYERRGEHYVRPQGIQETASVPFVEMESEAVGITEVYRRNSMQPLGELEKQKEEGIERPDSRPRKRDSLRYGCALFF
jgi:hypothetical protein